MKKLVSLILTAVLMISCLAMLLINSSAAPEVIGTKFALDKNYDGSSGTPYITSGGDKGIFTEADVDENGELYKAIQVYNTGTVPFIIKFRGQVLHHDKDSGYMSLAGPVDNASVTVLPGTVEELTFFCDAEFDINDGGYVAEYTYADMFARFDIMNEDGGKNIQAGFEMVVVGLNNSKLQKYAFGSLMKGQPAYASDIEGIEAAPTPTEEPTPAPTEEPTEAPTEAPTNAPTATADATNAPQTTEAPDSADNNNSSTFIIIGVAVALAVVVGVIITVIIIKRKKAE